MLIQAMDKEETEQKVFYIHANFSRVQTIIHSDTNQIQPPLK